MSRDFILVLAGGVVSLTTTFIVLFIMNLYYRKEDQSRAEHIDVHASERSSAGTSKPSTIEVNPAMAERARTGIGKSVAERTKEAIRLAREPGKPTVVEDHDRPIAAESAGELATLSGGPKTVEVAPAAKLEPREQEIRAISEALAASA